MNEENETYEIIDLPAFVESSRVLVYSSFGENKNPEDHFILKSKLSETEATELDNVLTQEECMAIAKNYVKLKRGKISKRKAYFIDSKHYMQMISSLNDRLVSNLLRNLVSEGLVETAFDSESNDFIFWVKEDENKDDKEST